MQHVTVRVPASTSNLGPGFDCLGVALRIHNTVTVARGVSRQHLHPLGARLFHFPYQSQAMSLLHAV